MGRTFNCTDEIIVVSEGKNDIGKIPSLGNDGKLDPSVLPELKMNKLEIARVYASISQTVGTIDNNGTYLLFDKLSFDTGNLFDQNNLSEFNCKEHGIYRLTASAYFKYQTGGIRVLCLVKRNDNARYLNQDIREAGSSNQSPTTCSVCCIQELNVGDNVQVAAFHSSSNSVETLPHDDYGVVFSVEKLCSL